MSAFPNRAQASHHVGPEHNDLEGVLDFVNHRDTSRIMVSVMEDFLKYTL